MTYAEQRQMLEEAAAVTPFTEKEGELITKCTDFAGPLPLFPMEPTEGFMIHLILRTELGYSLWLQEQAQRVLELSRSYVMS